jgi:hypothetical protein
LTTPPVSVVPVSIQPVTVTVPPITPQPVSIPLSVQPVIVPTFGTLQPATFQPQTYHPATLQPATLQPATLQPATLQPQTFYPATLQPASLQPVLPTPTTPTPSLRPVTTPPIYPPVSSSTNCYETWSPKSYQPGDIITGKDGRNYACDSDYFLYCSWIEFEPGTGAYPDYSSLAWNLLSTVCSESTATSPPVPTSPSSPSLTSPTPPQTGCPAPFDDSKVYIAGNIVSYASVIYQCKTSNGRCYQAGYEPWSALVDEAWLVVGTCTASALVTTCPPFYDKFLRVYTAGDLASYGNVIYQVRHAPVISVVLKD